MQLSFPKKKEKKSRSNSLIELLRRRILSDNNNKKKKRCRLGRIDGCAESLHQKWSKSVWTTCTVFFFSKKKTFHHFFLFFFFKYRVTSDTFEMTDTHLHVKWVLLFHVQQTNVYPVKKQLLACIAPLYWKIQFSNKRQSWPSHASNSATDEEYIHKTWPEKNKYSTLSLNILVIMPA